MWAAGCGVGVLAWRIPGMGEPGTGQAPCGLYSSSGEVKSPGPASGSFLNNQDPETPIPNGLCLFPRAAGVSFPDSLHQRTDGVAGVHVWF